VSFLNNGFVPTCHHCGKKGHIAPKCPLKNSQSASQQTQGGQNTQNDSQAPASAQGATTGAVQMLMHAANDHHNSGLDFSFYPSNNLASQSNNYLPSFCFANIMSNPFQNITSSQQIILRNGGFVDPYWILLDTQSTVNLFNNRLLLSNIRKTTGPPLCCYCNGGYQDSTLIGTLDGYGNIWYILIHVPKWVLSTKAWCVTQKPKSKRLVSGEFGTYHSTIILYCSFNILT
jgi:hypothetical protein